MASLRPLYTSDLPKGHFRLLKRQEDVAVGVDVKLRYELVSLAFDHAPSYDALSYRWSDPDPTRQEAMIVCDGVEVAVGPTLYDVLIHLRSFADSSVYLWVDYICIRQSDEDEKQRQILMMPQIYKTARRVVIWVGPSSAETEKALSALVWFIEVMDAFDESLRPGSERSLSRLEAQAYEIVLRAADYPPTPPFEEMARFLSRQWFGRVWTLQEAALSSDTSVVAFGARTLLYSRLLHLAERYANDSRGNWISLVRMIRLTTKSESIDPEDPPRPLMTHFKTVLRMRQLLMTNTNHSKSRRSVVRLLDYLRPFESSDPKDRIFAAAAFLPSELITAISVGSPLSTEDVYQLFGTIELGTYQNIQCLAAAGLSQHRRSYPRKYGLGSAAIASRLPSWVPDWAFKKMREPLWVLNENLIERHGQSLYQAGGNSGPSVSVSSTTCGEPMANVRGSIFDVIVDHGSPYRVHRLPPDFDAEQNPEILLEHFRDYQRQISDYIALARRHFKPNTSDSVEPMSILTTIRKTLIGNMVPDNPGTTLGGVWKKARREHIDPIFVAIDEIVLEAQQACDGKSASTPQQQSLSGGSTRNTTQRDAQRREEVERTLQKAIKAGEVDTVIDKALKDVPSVEKFALLSVSTMCKGRNFFVTRDGRIGVGPDILEKGDKVCLIYGLCTPFVIRTVKRSAAGGGNSGRSSDEPYELVGECYVEGLMEGEGIDNTMFLPEQIHLM